MLFCVNVLHAFFLHRLFAVAGSNVALLAGREERGSLGAVIECRLASAGERKGTLFLVFAI